MFIILLAIYNSIAIPLEITFRPKSLETNTAKILNRIIDIFFGLDILISFRTTYDDSDGNEITDGCMIAKNYFFGRFLIDLMSTIPFDEIGD